MIHRMLRLLAQGLVVAWLFAPAQEPVGTVLDVQGQWVLESRPPLTLERGSPLPSGGLVRPPQRPGPGDRLLAVFVFDGDNTRALRLTCETQDACRDRVQLPTLPRSYRLQAQVKRLRDALWLLTSSNTRYVPTMARSDDTLREGVVRLEAGTVDLTPVLGPLPNQRYVARFTPISSAGDAAAAVASQAFTLARASSVPVTGLTAGVHRMELLVAGGSTRAGPDVWVLAADAAAFTAKADAFAQASQTAGSWKDAFDPSTRQAFLRAFLMSVADDKSAGR